MAKRTIRKGGRIGKGYNYVLETGEVTYSNDPSIPVGSNVYDKKIRKDIRKEEDRPTDDDGNRVRRIMHELKGVGKSADDLMLEILEAVKDSVTPVPIPGKFYTYVYNAETPNIVYDQHPLIACTEIFQEKDSVYFIGFNYHWGKYRKYKLDNTVGQIYEVYSGEIADLREISYAKFLNS